MGNLRKVLRAHQQVLLTYDLTDTIASHSFRAAFIGYFLAKELDADADKVLKMCLAHDIAESRSMDHHWLSKKYVKVFEDEISRDQLGDLPHAADLLEVAREYEARKTLEAKIAKDADLLDEVFLLREYEWQGNKEAANWLYGRKRGLSRESQQEKLMFAAAAKQIAREIKKQAPSDWWSLYWTPNRR